MKDYSEWKIMEVIADYAPLKGKKKVKAIYITEENVKEVEELTQAFTRFSDDRKVLLTGFMSFNSFPTWMININPRGKNKKFIFESRIDRILREEVAEVKRDKEWLLEKIENYIPLHDRTVGDVINGILEIAKKLDEPEMKSEEKCHWVLSTVLDCVIWHSDCGLDWQFSNPETPAENEMNYCPKCGKKLEVAE